MSMPACTCTDPLPTAVIVTCPVLPTTSMADWITSSCRIPTVMIAWSASSPVVVSTTNSWACFASANVCVAPKTLAMSRLNSTGSTTTTFFAAGVPRALHRVAAHPAGAVDHDGLRRPARRPRTPPNPSPSAPPQPTSAATSNGMSGGIRMHDHSDTTAYWEKVPSTHSPPRSSPSSSWKRNVPSGNMPVPAFFPSLHRFCRPVEQYRHLPQAGMNEQTTWSPTATRVTSVADRVHHAGALVPADDGHPHRRVALLDVVVGVAQPGRVELDPDLVGLRLVQLEAR